jgi:peptide/nickel transport system permease protein
MFNYALRRLAYSTLLLFLVATAIFFILHLMPGSPYERIIREMAERNPQALARIPDSHWQRLNALYGLDKPIHERYFAWTTNIFRGRFGETWSVAAGQSVFGVMGARLPYTLLLMLTATLLAFSLAVPLGVYSAVHQYEDADFVITAASYMGIAMPTFWLGYVLIAVFSSALDWLPYGGAANRDLAAAGGDIITLIGRILSLGFANRQLAGQEGQILVDGIKHLIMPTLTLSLHFAARWLRIVRSSMLEVLGHDYMRTARAKGLPERLVLLKHGLRNGLIPLITLMALDIPTLFAGSFITENVFSWPGIGRLFVDGLRSGDWPLLQGLLMVNACLIVAANLIADLLYHVADPRIGRAQA